MIVLHNSRVLLLAAGLLVAGGAAALLVAAAAAPKKEGSESQVAHALDQRFFMLNALWFKPDGGAEKYDEYLKAAGPFVKKHGGKPHQAYVPQAALIGEFDADLVFFVEWPDQKAFTEFIQDPGYRAISHLRTEAIRDSLLIRCKQR